MGTAKSGRFRTDPTRCRSGKHILIEVGEAPDGHCKGCLKEWHRAYRAANSEMLKARARERFKAKYTPHPKPERAECGRGHTYAITGRYADGHCAECGRERDRQRQKEREQAIARSPELKNRHQRYERGTRLQRTYGLKRGEYEQMLDAQHGLCAVCEKPETTVRRGVLMRLSVDHNHTTGRKRGLLCNCRNRAIGLLKDDIDLLRKMIAYLTEPV